MSFKNNPQVSRSPKGQNKQSGGDDNSRRDEATPRHGKTSTKAKKYSSIMKARVFKKGTGRPIEDEDFYHGMLPRQDVNMLLKKQGDFLVRTTQKTDGSDHTEAVSVMWDARVRHVIPNRTPKGHFYVEEFEFESVGDLVRYYFNKGTRLSRKVEAILLHPVPKPDWELRKSQVILEKKLGEGAFGEVHRGSLILPNRPNEPPLPVAVKVTHAGSMNKSQLQEFMLEARLMRDYNHPNVVKFYGVVVESEPIMIVMELVKDGSLDSHLKKNAHATTQYDRIHYSLDAARGLEYLHKKSCMHRDIAARNCLLGGGRVKIADFGLCRETKVHYKMDPKKKVPIRWLSPETLSTATYTFKSDVFSFGVMVWEVYSDGVEPYPGMPAIDVQRQVKSGYRMEHPTRMPRDVQDVVNQCWYAEPDRRPPFTDIAEQLERIAKLTPRLNTSLSL